MPPPILTTKLHIPAPRRDIVPRPRLLERLDQGLRRKLTVVSAPAGFGKTTLLATWMQRLRAAHHVPLATGWITLDDADNDPARFCTYLSAALPGCDAANGPPGRSAPDDAHLAELINRVAEYPGPVLLVLDDYHLLTARAVHRSMAFLVDHLPDNLHLVLASRADPPLPLPRLRVRDELVELRQGDLRFTLDEAAAFLNQVMGLELAAADVAALEARTEGWIAGLQMAALSLQGHGPRPRGAGREARAAFVQAFTGSHRYVLDYLVEEVLDQQPPDLQEFLVRTSILERLSGPLCDALAGDGEPGDTASPSPSQAILEGLEAANLFIVALDDERRWYRYHRLFADLLRKRLLQRPPEFVDALHRRASDWHEAQGLLPEAIEHALAGHDVERAAALIEAGAETTLKRSELATFLRWMEALPDEVVRQRPALCIYHAWVLLMSGGSLDRVEARLRDVARAGETEEGVSPELSGRVMAMRAYLMLFQGDAGWAAELGRQALALLPEGDRLMHNIAHWILSMARLEDADPEAGQLALEEVARRGQEIGNPLIAVVALCHQAKLAMRQGRLGRAQEILEGALRLATDPGGHRLPIASEALLGLGELQVEWNDLDAAEATLAEAIELAGQWSELSSFDAYLPLSRLKLARGDVAGAQEALETARRMARRSDSTEVDDLVAELQSAHLAVVLGDVDAGMAWAKRRGLLPAPDAPQDTDALPESDAGATGVGFARARLRKYEQMVLARLLPLMGQPAGALDLLASLLDLARELGRADLMLQARILSALAWRAAGHPEQALTALAEALALAEPGGYVRIFLDEGEPMAELLRLAASRGVAPAYVARLLAALGGVAPEEAAHEGQLLVEPLSPRELEVLRLLAQGLSNPEIAEALVVAVSTVRSHCKSIYGKLGVHRRWDAVRRGRELGMI